jgi:hypothetical protein
MEQRDFVDVKGRRTGSGRLVRKGFSLVLTIGLGATIALMIPPSLTAQGESAGRVCSNATLRGNYGLLASGTRALPPGGVPERFIALALWTFDGNGTFIQQPGSVLKGEFTGVNPDPGEIGGTYHIEANCTGRLLLHHVPGLPFPIEYGLVAVDNAKKVMATVMSPASNLVTVELVRQ